MGGFFFSQWTANISKWGGFFADVNYTFHQYQGDGNIKTIRYSEYLIWKGLKGDLFQFWHQSGSGLTYKFNGPALEGVVLNAAYLTASPVYQMFCYKPKGIIFSFVK